MSAYPKRLSASLRDAAALHALAAAEARTIEDEDTRNRNAKQLRFVAALVTVGHEDMGEAWLSASNTLLASYRVVDSARDALAATCASYGTELYAVTATALATLNGADHE